MTEDSIERVVARKFDRLDSWLLTGRITQETYDEMAREIHGWAETKYAERRAPQ